jgi:hypothetical protein
MAKTHSSTEAAIEGFAEDLGTLLGTARSKAEGWLSQRKSIASQLATIRDTASELLQQLTGGSAQKAAAVRRGRRGRPRGSQSAGRRGPGRPKGSGGRKKRTMSAEARAAISAAQKARWAKLKAGEKKKK